MEGQFGNRAFHTHLKLSRVSRLGPLPDGDGMDRADHIVPPSVFRLLQSNLCSVRRLFGQIPAGACPPDRVAPGFPTLSQRGRRANWPGECIAFKGPVGLHFAIRIFRRPGERSIMKATHVFAVLGLLLAGEGISATSVIAADVQYDTRVRGATRTTGCAARHNCCPDRYACSSLYGAYGPYGGSAYVTRYTYGGWAYVR
jgi:hypothetical protein